MINFLGSWVLSHYYNKKSSAQIEKLFENLLAIFQDWAKSFDEKWPQSKPSEVELLKLFQQALDTGEIVHDPILGYVACPECNAPASDFQGEFLGDECHEVVRKTCPHCHWSKDVEL
jgi:hypothetical protein